MTNKQLQEINNFMISRCKEKNRYLLWALIIVGLSVPALIWLVGLPWWAVVWAVVVETPILSTVYYVEKVNDLHRLSVINQLDFQRLMLYYNKDLLLVKLLEKKDVTSSSEIDFIEELRKSASTGEASLLISEILRQKGYSNYKPEENFEENEE